MSKNYATMFFQNNIFFDCLVYFNVGQLKFLQATLDQLIFVFIILAGVPAKITFSFSNCFVTILPFAITLLFGIFAPFNTETSLHSQTWLPIVISLGVFNISPSVE